MPRVEASASSPSRIKSPASAGFFAHARRLATVSLAHDAGAGGGNRLEEGEVVAVHVDGEEIDLLFGNVRGDQPVDVFPGEEGVGEAQLPGGDHGGEAARDLAGLQKRRNVRSPPELWDFNRFSEPSLVPRVRSR